MATACSKLKEKILRLKASNQMRFTETVTMIMMLTMMSTTMMVMTTMPHVSRYPQVEAEVPLLRRALQLLTIFGATGSQKTSKKYHLIFVTKKLSLSLARQGPKKIPNITF